MTKYIRALEVPFYLLVIAYACVERGNTGLAIFLGIVSVLTLVIAMACLENGDTGIAILLGIISILRLLTNVLTDDFIYKNNK